MARAKTITGLDIGTDSIKILGVKNDSKQEISIILDKIDSFGVLKGRIKDAPRSPRG
jgi:cell division ATPase FtsA